MRRRGWSVCVALLGIVYLYRKRAILVQIAAVLLLAAAFALMLAPLCMRLERRGIRASAAAALSVGALVLVLLLIGASFVPYLAVHALELFRSITPTLTALVQQGSTLLARLGLHVQPQGETMQLLAGWASQATAYLARGGMAFAAQAGQMAFALVISYYLLCRREQAVRHLLLCLPMEARTPFLSMALGCKNDMLCYLSGVFKTCLFVAGATYLGLLVLGVRDALLLALFMGVFEVLPYIGPVLAAVPIVLTALPQGLGHALLALAAVVLVQQLESNFVTPYFTASCTSIHPLLSLVGVFVLGSLMGLWGIFLAVPLLVLLRSLIWFSRRWENEMKR